MNLINPLTLSTSVNKVFSNAKPYLWVWGIFELFSMHLIFMHNSILQVFTVVLTRTTLLFSDFGFWRNPRTPKGMNAISATGKLITCSYLLKCLLENYLQNLNILSPLYKRKHKTYFFNNMTIWLSTWVVVTYYGWQMGPW